MRFVAFAAACACLSLAACGGSGFGEANNAKAKIISGSSTSMSAVGHEPAPTIGMAMLAVPLSKARALEVMKARHDGMVAIGDANKAAHRALAGSSPDLPTVRSSAARIAQLSHDASGWFPQGTGPDVAKTGAKPDIWQSPEDFAAKLRSFQSAAAAFNAAASGSDVAAMNARYSELGGACKACHDKYRAEMKH
jgi:cytochrome c556